VSSGTVRDLRPTWDKTWMNMAHVIAERSLCDRDKVGAVVVSATNRLLDTGYNGPPRGMPRDESGCANWCPRAAVGLKRAPNPAYDDCNSIHAEANALLFGDRSQRAYGTIYISSGVCSGCAKLIANSGLTRVVCDVTHVMPHRDSDMWFTWLRHCGLRVDEMKH
jgi:dCMP deaminase